MLVKPCEKKSTPYLTEPDTVTYDRNGKKIYNNNVARLTRCGHEAIGLIIIHNGEASLHIKNGRDPYFDNEPTFEIGGFETIEDLRAVCDKHGYNKPYFNVEILY